jgi:predicted transcriptional regulator
MVATGQRKAADQRFIFTSNSCFFEGKIYKFSHRFVIAEMPEEAIIRFLRERGSRGALQSEVVEATGYSKSTISHFLTKLESKGIVYRRRERGSGLRVWLKGFESSSKFIRVGMVRAAEYPFIFDFKSRLEEIGYGVHLRVYEDGVSLMSDLVRGRIEVGLSPLITQLVFYAASRGKFKIVASGVSGGGSVILRRGLGLSDVKRAGSTLASTMDACLTAYLREKGLSDVEVVYFDSPQRMVEALERSDVEMLSIWEPYSSMLEVKGHRRLARFNEFMGVFPCCVLALNLADGELERLVADVFVEALSKREYADCASKLGGLIDVEPEIVRRCLAEYEFHPRFEARDVKGYLKSVGLEATTRWIAKALSYN